jgi:hypothetical protein
MGLPGVESFDAFFGGATSSSMTTDNPTYVSKLPRITLGYSRSTRAPLPDIATATHDSTAGIANHAPSPSMSSGYVSDLRSGNIVKDVEVSASCSSSMAFENDGDHAGISDDLSCVGEGSELDEFENTEEFHECLEDHVPEQPPQGGDYINYSDKSRADGYSYFYRRFSSLAHDGGTTSNLGARDDVAANISCLCANDDDPPSSLGARNDVVVNIDCLYHQSGNVRRNYVEIFPLLPILQYDIACVCVAISHRPFEGLCSGAELSFGQARLLITEAMPPKESQGMDHGGTPRQGGGQGNLAKIAQPIAVSKIGSAPSAKVGSTAVGPFSNAPKTNTTIPGHTGPPAKSTKVSPPRGIVLVDEATCAAEYPLPSAKKPSGRKRGGHHSNARAGHYRTDG